MGDVIIRGCCVYDSVAEAGDRGAASGLWLTESLCGVLTVMLGGDLEVANQI